MKEKQTCQIFFFHNGQRKTIEVRKGLGFQAFSEKHGLEIEYDCRKADCGVCIIRILKGMENLSEATPEEKDFLKAMKADPEERLACQARVLGDVECKQEFS